MGNQEPELQLRSKQPSHLSSLPVLIYISILCCSPISFPSSEIFFCLFLWEMCQLSGLGSRKSAGTELLAAPSPWNTVVMWAAWQMLGQGVSRGGWLACPTATETDIPVWCPWCAGKRSGEKAQQRSCALLPHSHQHHLSMSCLSPTQRDRGVPGHLPMGQDLCRFWFSPSSFSALCGCMCWFIHQWHFSYPEIIWPFAVQQYGGTLNNESSGSCCFVFSESTSLQEAMKLHLCQQEWNLAKSFLEWGKKKNRLEGTYILSYFCFLLLI